MEREAEAFVAADFAAEEDDAAKGGKKGKEVRRNSHLPTGNVLLLISVAVVYDVVAHVTLLPRTAPPSANILSQIEYEYEMEDEEDLAMA